MADSRIFGIPAAIIVALVSVYFAVVDRNSSSELETARKAVALAEQAELDADNAKRTAEEERRVFFQLRMKEDDEEKASQLYQAMIIMRGVLERGLSDPELGPEALIQKMVELADRPLVMALGFRMAEHYTICAYKAETNPQTHDKKLRCIAHLRTLMCPIEKARTWPAGVGVAGVAFSQGREVIVPDLGALAIGTIYGDNLKEGDAEKYKSIAVHPILVGEGNRPWGVIVATSDRQMHFEIDEEPGIRTSEGVRALAGMAALAVKICERRPPRTQDSGKVADPRASS